LARKAFGYALKITTAFHVHYVYVLRSVSDDGLYIAYSANLRRRFTQHVEGGAFATSYRGPWKLIYYEAYTEQADALGRERYFKSGGGRRFLRLRLAHYLKKNPIGGDRRE
jgi:putative endonuclease